MRGGDVLAWAEVEFDGIGWVPFYPTPSRTRSGEGGDVAEGAPKQAKEIEQAINEDATPPKPTKTPHQAPHPTFDLRQGRLDRTVGVGYGGRRLGGGLCARRRPRPSGTPDAPPPRRRTGRPRHRSLAADPDPPPHRRPPRHVGDADGGRGGLPGRTLPGPRRPRAPDVPRRPRQCGHLRRHPP
ncbi:hypothetical protein GCM10020001_075660 [Nonomuraea salmonea]